MTLDELRNIAKSSRESANKPGIPESLKASFLKKAAMADQEIAKLLNTPTHSNATSTSVNEGEVYIEKNPTGSKQDHNKWKQELSDSNEAGGYTSVIPFDTENKDNNPTTEENPDAVEIADKPELNPVNRAPVEDYLGTGDYKIWRERLQLSMGRGQYGQSLVNSLMGFNHRMVTDPIPQGRDYGSLVFFVRPGINLSAVNVENSRRWVDMIRKDRTSIDYSIMAALDVMWPYGFANPDEARIGKPFTEDIMFDNRQAFIPILTRLCTDISGFADNQVDSWVSEEGVKREQVALVDSTWELNERRTISTTFDPMLGNPVERLITIWLEYMAGRKEGRFQKRMSCFVQRRVDYFSAIYSIKTDPLGKLVQFDVACEVYPTNNAAGARANQNLKEWSSAPQPITIQWECLGLRYFDPLYMERFNDTVAICNPDMLMDPDADQSDGFVPMGASYLRKLTPEEAKICNWEGFPHIDSERQILDWYIYQEDYERLMKAGGLL